MSKDQNKILIPHLESFEKIKEWTDLGNWLQKTAKFLETYPTQNIPNKKILAKRLSQCLHENLPIGIHRTTLSIYSIIFETLKSDKYLLCQNINIYSYGLFPFFVKSSIQVKPELLQIFKKYYLCLGIEIVPMLSGFMGCLLPGLEEQEQKFKENIFQIFEDINKVVGNKFFISTLWLILLKNSKNRASCFKILNKKFQDFQKNVQNDFEFDLTQKINQRPHLIELCTFIQKENNSIGSYFPNASMVINALSKSLEDEEIFIRKTCLDFCNKYIEQFKNFSKYQFFTKQHQIVFYTSILKLFKKNDISINKRVAKLLFDKHEFQNINLNNDGNKDLLNLLSESFENILKEKIEDIDQSRLPFLILDNIGQNNEKLLKYIIDYNSYNFFIFCYNQKNQHPDINKEISECSKSFLKNHQELVQSLIKNFDLKIKENIDFKNINFLDFVQQQIINTNLPLQNQLRFLATLMTISLRLLKNNMINFSSPSNTKSSIFFSNNKDNEQLFNFVYTCASQIEQILQMKYDSSYEKELEQFKVLEDQFSDLLNQILQNQFALKFFLNYFQKYFQMITILNHISNYEKKTIKNVNGIPNFLKILLQFLLLENDLQSFQAFSFFLKLFDLETIYPLIKQYQQFIYYTPNHYENDQICYVIFYKLIELFEINDFKNQCLQMYLKFVRINLNFVETQIENILKQKNNQSFQKVAQIWKATSHYTNTDCQLVLERSVFNMLDHAHSKNPILLNHFKNWLLVSQTTFKIIIDSICKELLKYTNWKVKDNEEIIYKIPFNCLKFIKSLENINILFYHSKKIFIQFLKFKEIKEEFHFYEQELQLTLKDNFVFKEKKYIYLFFIFKILLRYFIGKLDQEEKTNETEDHVEQIFLVKEKIANIFELILKNIEDDDIFALISLKLLPSVYYNLQKSLENNQITSQLVYLNLIQFLLFNSSVTKNRLTKDQIINVIFNDNYVNIIIMGLKNQHPFIIKEFINFITNFNIIVNENCKHQLLSKFAEKILYGYLDSITEKCIKEVSIKQEELFREQVQILLYGCGNFLEFYFKDTKEKRIKRNTGMLFNFSSNQQEEIILDFKRDHQTCQRLLFHFEFLFQRLFVTWQKIEMIDNYNIYNPFQLETKLIKQDDQQEILGINKAIIEIIEPLCYRLKNKIIQVLLLIWMKNNLIIHPNNLYYDDLHLENIKILEMLLQFKIQPLDFFVELKNCSSLQNLLTLKRYQKHSRKYYFLIRNDVVYESNILSFIYAFLKYQNFNKEDYPKIHDAVFELLLLFEKSIFPSTLSFILDIINLVIEKFQIENKSLFKNKYQHSQQISDIVNKIVRIINQEYQIQYEKPKKSFEVVFPLNPSITQIAQEKVKTLNQKQIVSSESNLKS